MKRLLLKVAYSVLDYYGELPLGTKVELGGIITFNGIRYCITDMHSTICYGSGSDLSINSKEVMLYGRN